MSSVISDVYSGLAEVGYPLAVVSAVATTFICGYVIYMGLQAKKGLVNPLPVIPGKPALNPDQLGNLMVGTGIFVIVISWLWAWLASKYKSISALAAIGSIFTLLSSLLHMKMTC